MLITVTDVNDKRPVFEEKIGDNDCYIITEFHDLNEPVLTVRASDGDDPQTPNGQLEFEIISGKILQVTLDVTLSSGTRSPKGYIIF